MKRKNFYFASANTGDGFVNLLDKISNDGFMYIINGGPGTGKSTTMKKIAQHFFEAGNDVEYYYCSSDPQSLDGIRIVQKNVAVVDGTAPHIINPKILGVSHKVLNVGQYLGDLSAHKSTLKTLYKKKENHYQTMYAYLSAAKILDDINYAIVKESCNQNLVIKKAKNLFSKVKNFNGQLQNETLFLESLNSTLVNLERKNNFKKIVFEAGRYEAFIVLEELSNLLKKNCICHTKILDVLNPKKIYAIVLNNKIIIKNNKNTIKINKTIEKNNYLIKKIILNSQNEVAAAKELHEKMEEIYVQNVDFSGVEKLLQETIEEIEKFEG